MKTNRNELIRRLLCGITINSRIWFVYGKKQFEGEKQDALSPRLEEGYLLPLPGKWGSLAINPIFWK